MHYIHHRLFPKNSFTSSIFSKLVIHYNERILIAEPFIKSINIKNKEEYNYQIDIQETSTTFRTMLSSDFNEQKLKIYETIKFYNHKNTKRINYSCIITQNVIYHFVNDKPLIYNIKCCHQSIGFNLNNHYTKEMIDIFEHFIDKK